MSTKGDEENGPSPLATLEGDVITSEDVQKLQSKGYATVESLLFVPKKSLMDIPGLSEKTIDKLLAKVHELIPTGFMNAADLNAQRQELVFITTGSRQVDQLLGGGIEAGSITEVYGAARCGKSQLCFTLAVTCQLPFASGGGEGKCLFIDTEGTFRSERLLPVAQRFKLNVDNVLDNVAIARAMNTDHQTKLLIQAAEMMQKSKYALIIVDSGMSLYRTDFTGLDQLTDRQQHLNRFLRMLRKLADTFGVAIVVTNQVVATVNTPGQFHRANQNEAAGGHIFAHGAATRLELRTWRNNSRVCKVVKSPCLPEGEARFCISSAGISDEQQE